MERDEELSDKEAKESLWTQPGHSQAPEEMSEADEAPGGETPMEAAPGGCQEEVAVPRIFIPEAMVVLGQMNPVEKSRQSLQEGLECWERPLVRLGLPETFLPAVEGQETCWEGRNWELSWEEEAGAALLVLGEQRNLGSLGTWI